MSPTISWRYRLLTAATDLLIGALLALAGFFYYQSKLEEYHFSRLVHSALGLSEGQSSNHAPLTEANVLKIMHKVHEVVAARRNQVADVGHPQPGPLWSSDEHLVEPSGACSSFTQVLAKALRTAGYPVRKVGLSKDGLVGTHHILETYVEGHWAVLDALCDQSFRRADGILAGAMEVHENWPYYQKQTNPDYDQSYDFSGIYYTNWEKVPVIGFVVSAIPSLHRWLETNGVSLRFLLLDVNQWFAGLSVAAALVMMAVRLWPKLRSPKAPPLKHPPVDCNHGPCRPIAGLSAM